MNPMANSKYLDEWTSKLTVGQRLKFARTKREISQKELSRRSGIPPTSLSAYVNDRVEPPFIAIICLADALEVSLDWLAGRRSSEWRDLN